MPSAATLLRFSATAIPCHQRRSLPLTDLHLPFSVYRDVYRSGQTGIERQETFIDDKEAASMVYFANEKEEKIQSIKMMLRSMEDGEISISAYDTAWVALVKDINGSGVPQFPSSLQWIVENQLPDGSWGDRFIFSAHDRILNTLACIIALKSWNIYPELREKGLVFIRENMSKLESENEEHMPIGFEIAFPSLMEIAERQDLQVPTDIPVINEIYAKRNLKLTRIPKDMMHVVPTTLLHSLEGMDGLDWDKLLQLQCEDGSFLFSPSSTAFALMETKDERCLKYLKKAVQTFNGGVPNVYPVDLFEHIWTVDRLERLGISRYFKSEIKECLNYVFRYWSEDGICWARNSRVHDIDDTAMGFRLLRLHGHEVSPDAFRHFEKGGEFFCFAGQSNQAITGIFNLYRASQVLFPGESILEEAKAFASKFLREKQATNQLLDKWIITKDLPGEVDYALDFPWYASLPRIEARFYIEQYGGDNDVWIGKTLYRMPYVNNNEYLELAEADFNNCQALHQLEWTAIQKWYKECNLGEFGVGRKQLLQAYFVATASIFEPERANERLAWARTALLVDAVKSYMEMDTITVDKRKEFVSNFNYTIRSCSTTNFDGTVEIPGSTEWKTTGKKLMEALVTTLNSTAVETLMIQRLDVRHPLLCAWNTWLLTWCLDKVVEKKQHGTESTGEGELVVFTINLCAGRSISEEYSFQPHYQRLLYLTNSICLHLRLLLNSQGHRKKDSTGTGQIDPLMQELVQLVLRNSDGIDPDFKRTFLTVAKSFYYVAHCTPATINYHINKVLFQTLP
ncbi:ent-copalyl diphosphate synthase 1-like isoform X2 [Macadamia integrifolia]|uniref:ent-copalyl diphosphate synthase 1-like isoform X2 n=1 Tax=Macadamia integrifolia TaxID=60698 RepID=UPI001C4EE79C|nr:ent-copalyl diphosphate synthase 1-like isoform X2 [Macadamia integrifolia]